MAGEQRAASVLPKEKRGEKENETRENAAGGERVARRKNAASKNGTKKVRRAASALPKEKRGVAGGPVTGESENRRAERPLARCADGRKIARMKAPHAAYHGGGTKKRPKTKKNWRFLERLRIEFVAMT